MDDTSAEQGDAYDDEPYDDEDEPAPRGRFRRLQPKGSLSRPVLVGAALAVVLLLGAVTFFLIGGDDEQDTASAPSAQVAAADGQYDPKIRKLFLDECIRASEGDVNYCTCTLEKLEAAYSQGEYIEFNDNVDDAESKRIIREISQSCRAAK